MVFISPYVTQMWFSSLSAIQFIIFGSNFLITLTPLQRSKVKVIPQQTEVAQGVLGRLMPRIFLTFGTTRVLGRQPYAPAAFSPGGIPDTRFQRLIRPQGAWFRRESHGKNPGTRFQWLIRPQGTWLRREPRKKSWYSFSVADPTPGHMVPSGATEKILVLVFSG